MVTVVVILNTLIAVVNFYIAWRVWKLRRQLAGATKAILAADRNTYNVLHVAPGAIAKGQKGSNALGQNYRRLEIQLQSLRQLLALSGLLQRTWQRNWVKSSPKVSRLERKSKLLKKALGKDTGV
jgi:hypothetical protein